MTKEDELNDAVEAFRNAESSLRSLLDAAEQLKTAKEEINAAQSAVKEAQEEAIQRLEVAEESLAETRSTVYRLVEELKPIARDLGDTSRALTSINAQEVIENIAATRSDQAEIKHRLDELPSIRSDQAAISEHLEAVSDQQGKLAESQRVTRLWSITCCALIAVAAMILLVVQISG
jgi:chromosome segregation ATPase